MDLKFWNYRVFLVFANTKSITLRKPRITHVTSKLKSTSFCGNLRFISFLLCKEEILLLTLGLWLVLHFSHMLVVHTPIIQLPQAHETCGFQCRFRTADFSRAFLWAKILGRLPAFSKKRHERKFFIPTGIESEIFGLIDQCVIYYTRVFLL